MLRKRTLVVAIALALPPPLTVRADAPPLQVTIAGPVERVRFRYPLDNGDPRNAVLYDQTAASYPDGVPAHRDSDGAQSALDSEGADDFRVGDPAGWTVSAFNVAVVFRNGTPEAGTTYNLAVYADAGGVPSATPVCTYGQIGGVLGEDRQSLSIGLPTPCFLPQGQYWLSVQAHTSLAQFNQMFWLDWEPAMLPGGYPKWRNPGDGFAVGCTDWRDLNNCPGVGSGNGAYAFQVIGALGDPGCSGDGLCVEATVTPFDFAQPDACGTATTISARIGDQINLCYRVTNQSAQTLTQHAVRDNVNGVHGYGYSVLLSQPLAAGESFQYRYVHTVGDGTPLTLAWTGYPALPGYTGTLTASQFADISAYGVPLHMPSAASRTVSMPFSFDFYGETANTLCIHSYGTIVVGRSAEVSCAVATKYNNSSLPVVGSSDPVRPAMFVLWDDFDSRSGDVYTHVRGHAPDREFVVQWDRRGHLDAPAGGDTATFQAVIRESDGRIRFEYPDVDFDGGSAAALTIGLQGAHAFTDAGVYGGIVQPADQYDPAQGSIVSGSAIEWTRVPVPAYTSHATIQIEAGRPGLAVTPAVVNAAADGTPATVELTIGNPGDYPLQWALGRQPDESRGTEAGASRRHAVALGASIDDARVPGPPVLTPTQIEAWQARRPRPDAGDTGPAALPAYLIGGALTGPGLVPHYVHALHLLDVLEPSNGLDIGPNGQALALYFRTAFADNDFSRVFAARLETDASGMPIGGRLALLDTATGALTELPNGAPSPREYWAGLSWDPASQRLYGVGCAVDGACRLYTIDTATYAVTPVAPITGLEFYEGRTRIIDVAFDSRGRLWGIDGYTSALVAIDKDSGRANTIGTTGIIPFDAYSHGLDFDHASDTLYWYASGSPLPGPWVSNLRRTYSIDLDTGQARYLGDIGESGGAVSMAGLAIQRVAGACAQPSVPAWLSYDVDGGTTAAGETRTVSLRLDPAGLAAGTHTGTLCVFGAGLLVAEVPLRFTVEGSETLFADGFEEGAR